MNTFRSYLGTARVCISRRFTIGLVLIVGALSACALSSARTNVVTQEGNSTVNTENASPTRVDARELELTVSVDNTRWRKEGPILVKLRLRNNGKVPVSGISSFSLVNLTEGGTDPLKAGFNLWAPVFVQKTGVRPAEGPGSTRLGPNETIDVEVDFLKLKWGIAIGNSWPDETFSQADPDPGEYEVSFEMHVKDGEASQNIQSNRVKVSIK